ncbi:hypothetical protein FQN57_004316 [Myotisia sp. PD_48]|nr:hypothetical protein FQN57_004316 [Myotisia sp. PD_48]
MSDSEQVTEKPPARSGSSGNISRASTLEVSSIESVDGINVEYQQDEDHDRHLTPVVSLGPSLARRVTSVGTTGTSDPNFEVDWENQADPNNPQNWSFNYKCLSIFGLSWNTTVVVLYSTSYTAATAEISREFNISETIVTLGLTFYLVGLAVGSLFMAPLSEIYGRKPVAVGSLLFFLLLIIPCGLGTSITGIIIARFFNAVAGSVMISSAPGMVSDMVSDERRSLALSVWSIGPLNGPVLGPIIGGFVTQYLGWRWTNWVVMMLSGVGLVLAIFTKESYAPALLRRKAVKLRKETDDSRWWSRYDQKQAIMEVLRVNLSRPFTMALTEPICIFWNVYLSLIYAILYLCFVAYPIVFREIRGWSVAMSGLAFIGIGIGGLLVVAVEPLLRRMINSHKPDPETGKPPPEAMVSVVCIAALFAPIGELWFAWTCSPASIHWSIPIISGIVFGAGNNGVFIYAQSYISHSYGVYTASAMAGNAVVRSVMGGVFPLIGPYLYRGLGPNWAGTLLTGLEILILPIPFVFYRYGYKIRMKSVLIRRMQEEKKRLEGKRSTVQKQPLNLGDQNTGGMLEPGFEKAKEHV